MGINEISQLQLGEKEYRELLLQAVAVIDNSKSLLAQSVCSIATNSYWGIGKLLFERKLESRYGEGIVRRLSGDLKEHFPQMGLSTRQLWNMKAFYIRYKDCDNFATTLLKMISCVFEEHQAEDNVFVF